MTTGPTTRPTTGPSSVVLTYPGQGGFSAGLVARLRWHPDAAAALDCAARSWLAETGEDLTGIWANPAAGLPELAELSFAATQVSIFAAAVAAHAAVRDAIPGTPTHLGHSFGEVAALTAAGAFTIEEGAQVVAARVAALTAADAGAMTAVVGDERTVAALVAAVADPSFVVAGRAGSGQTVVSGRTSTVERFEHAAAALEIPTVRLASPYPFHSPLVRAAVPGFVEAVRRVGWRAPRQPVYSAILGRHLTADDDLAQVLGDGLTEPFDLAAAVTVLSGSGAGLFVECGGRTALTGAVQRTLPPTGPGSAPAALATDDGPQPGSAARAALAARGGGQLPAEPVDPRLLAALRELLRADLEEMVRGLVADGSVAAGQPSREEGHGPGPEAGPRTGPVTLAVAPPAREEAPGKPLDRAAVLAQLVTLYAEALEYPEEVLAEDVELEADLGVDSVKQTELLGRAATRFNLPAVPADLAVTSLPTLGAIADLVLGSRAAAA